MHVYAQVWRAALFWLVVISARNAQSYAVLARLLWIVWVLPGASNLSCPTRIAACGNCKQVIRGQRNVGETDFGIVSCWQKKTSVKVYVEKEDK